MQHLVIVPEGAPSALRGRTVLVTFFISATGVVDRLETRPRIEDGGYARRFEERLRSYRFRPALDSTGRPVPGRFPMQVDLPSR
jgi:hypothetical protein